MRTLKGKAVAKDAILRGLSNDLLNELTALAQNFKVADDVEAQLKDKNYFTC
jgi:hypothetical protein